MSSKKKSRYKSKNKNLNASRSSSFQASSEKKEEQNPASVEEKPVDDASETSTLDYGSVQGENTVVMFFNDTNAYIEHFESVLSQSQGDIRVNVVIKSQDNISSKRVPSNIFLYTGEVWWNIHKQREQSGYYKKVVNIDR